MLAFVSYLIALPKRDIQNPTKCPSLSRVFQFLPLAMPMQVFMRRLSEITTYPEVQIQVSTTTKLAVADLEGDGHPVVGVQHLVEALARVRLQLHVVGKAQHYAGQ